MANTKTNSEMLKSIRQYNKTARETRAQKEGFSTAAKMITYLEGEIKLGAGDKLYAPSGKSTKKPANTKAPCPTTTKVPSTSKREPAKVTSKGTSVKKTIHIVDILDSSGSMGGLKIEAAIKGINLGTKQLKEDKANVRYTYTMCDFSDDHIFRHIKSDLPAVGTFKGGTRGSTALFDAIGKTVNKIKSGVTSNHKVLVNIYTDGQENASREFTATAVKDLISSLSENGWTFTFIGTPQDVSYVQVRLGIHASNTLAYDGTGAGLDSAFATNNASRSVYSQKVSAGEDVSKGFYKDIN